MEVAFLPLHFDGVSFSFNIYLVSIYLLLDFLYLGQAAVDVRAVAKVPADRSATSGALFQFDDHLLVVL